MGRVLGSRGAARGHRAPSADRLSADRIVAVAVAQLREHGYDSVTMRSIAHELDTGPASLYAHVASRAELDRLVVDWVCRQWLVPAPDPERWHDQLRTALLDLLRLYRANPGVARCTLGTTPARSGVPAPAEGLTRLLRAGGVAERHGAWFVDVATRYVASVALAEQLRDQDPHDDSATFGIDVLVDGLKQQRHPR